MKKPFSVYRDDYLRICKKHHETPVLEEDPLWKEHYKAILSVHYMDENGWIKTKKARPPRGTTTEVCIPEMHNQWVCDVWPTGEHQVYSYWRYPTPMPVV